MKNKTLLLTLLFFLIVNTSYYWSAKLGFGAMLAFLILCCAFLALTIELISKLYKASQENFKNTQRDITIVVILVVLATTLFKPFGLINYESFESKNILVAQREGVAGCMTTIKLKENNQYKLKEVCFGNTEFTGKYSIKNDTIYFENLKLGGGYNYKFALFKPTMLRADEKHSSNDKYYFLIAYKNKKDTTGYPFKVVENKMKN